MQQTMRVKLRPTQWSEYQLDWHKLKLNEWYIVKQDNGGEGLILELHPDKPFMRSAFTEPEPVPTPCPADWQPAPGHSVDHYEAECLDNMQCKSLLTVGKNYPLIGITNMNGDCLTIICDDGTQGGMFKERFATPTLRAEYRDKTEQVQSEVIDSNESTQPDPVNHPTHYNQNGYEVKDLIAAFNLNFFRGNCVKYASRAHLKGQELQDLMKVKTNIDFEIERMTNGEGVPITAELLVDIAMELLEQAKKMMKDGTKDI